MTSFYNEDMGQLSPGFRPGSAQEDMIRYSNDDRRPSIASATTVSSIGSKSSMGGRGYHKKLHGFFGDDFTNNEDSRQNSDSSLPSSALYGGGYESQSRFARLRNNSATTTTTVGNSQPGSPTNRPRSPSQSQNMSDVAPWEFQSSRNDKALPAAPADSSPQTQQPPPSQHPHRHHRLHLPGHRHSKSKEEPKNPILDAISTAPLRPSVSHQQSFQSLRREGGFNQPNYAGGSSQPGLPTRPTSPTTSIGSRNQDKDNMAQRSPGTGGKRTFFGRILGKKTEKPPADTLKDLPNISTHSLGEQRSQRIQKTGPPPGNTRRPTEPNLQKGATLNSAVEASKVGRLHLRRKGSEFPVGRDPNEVNGSAGPSGSIWKLDTNLDDMSGIVSHQGPMTPPAQNEIFTGWPPADYKDAKPTPDPAATANWDAPDSWNVKRIRDDNVKRLPELDEQGQPPKEDNIGPPYRVRIFRSDSTFAVLSVSLNTTVADIIGLMGKKTFLQDDLDNYHVVMRKHDTSRQLDPQERPLVLQRRLLEQAGYTEADRIEDIGGEDNSYLCRFTFLPAKMAGYSSLERDPGFNKMQKFSHIDLQGRNLITIPITLYQKATEIISLNLSRNLSLDVPKDFIQGCSNLRELKFTSNEAWKLPSSISLAGRLTTLDVSNNRLEQLEHADLHKLQSLVSLRLSNNKLFGLPKYFGQWRALRSLNLASNSLTEFPAYMCEIKTLVDLDISFNAITTLPEIGSLVKLERFWATNNKLSGSFPASTESLSSIREIDVRHNSFDNIDILATLPRLEFLYVGYNSISAFEGAFAKMRALHLNHNPVTRFGFSMPIPTLYSLNLEKAKLAALPDDLFQKVPALKRLNLDQNHFVSISPQLGKLTQLEHLSIARNLLSRLPPDIGRLAELRTLDLRENNLDSLPSQIWHCKKLETLNVSSNVLQSFPKPGAPLPVSHEPVVSSSASNYNPFAADTPGEDGLGNLEDFQLRRPSQASSYLSATGSPVQSRKASTSSQTTVNSLGGANGVRRPSTAARNSSEASVATITPVTRKDSSLSARLINTFAASLHFLYLADNRLGEDTFEELQMLPELKVLNLSYNLIYDIPSRILRRWSQINELYLSGNDLNSLPSEDLEEVSQLRVLHINNNKFQVLPAELAKVQKLAVIDVGSNVLKYNVSNWPYDWNWNWNLNLKYLNLSGNKRLEIKPTGQSSNRGGRDLTDFSSLKNLRILGLMDVTLGVQSIPDQSEDFRVRTSGSMVGSMAYGMADTLGRNEHLSTIDLVIDRFRTHDDETIFGMFDGQALTGSGSKIAKYLYENFKHRFMDELEKLRTSEGPADALRRTYLSLNKEIALAASNAYEQKQPVNGHRPSVASLDLNEEDINSGCVATVFFLKEMELYVSNVGDATALLIHTEGGHRVITRKHDPTDASERQRIREAGGFVSRHGKLNDVLPVSRAFGYAQFSPAVISAPHIAQITIRDSDEMILIASRELWNFLTRDFAVDVARSERNDLMRAAQKLRDLAIAFGASDKIMVMIIGISDLRRRERARFRTHSMSMGPSGEAEYYKPNRKKAGIRDAVADQKLARLDQEVEAPTGDVSLVFTDIKNSTWLWETFPIAMRTAIKMHNDLMRRNLRIIGGYEVKTEGDAFMVAFPTVTSALLWCFTMQTQLLEVPWPQEILNCANGQEVCDEEGNIIFRGLSVRMGIHRGFPVYEVDPVTKRMDYFGPMVNRASRISSIADGGQITVSSEFIAEIQRLLETHIETDRAGSSGSEEAMQDDMTAQSIRKELRILSSQGFEVKDLGERRLKGLENPEYIYLMYPHALSSRLQIQQQRDAAALASLPQPKDEQSGPQPGQKAKDSHLTFETETLWDMWNVVLRLEALCGTLEIEGATEVRTPEHGLLNWLKTKGGEISDEMILGVLEHQLTRIEVSQKLPLQCALLLHVYANLFAFQSCTNTLYTRNLVRPFRDGMISQACPMSDIFAELTAQLQELQILKQSLGDMEMNSA